MDERRRQTRLWPVDPLDVALQRMPRSLTDAERETFEVR